MPLEDKRTSAVSDDFANHKGPRLTALLYLQRNDENLLTCLTSLSNQILDDFEIICIDDSTNDLPLQDILASYAKKEPRLKIAHTKGAGFGRSVDQGIKFANGEYIAFVQPDDYLDPATFIELFALAKKHDADLVRSNYYERLEERQDLKHEIIVAEESDKLINPTETTTIFYQPPALWSTIYKKDYLINKKISFLNQKQDPYVYSFNFKSLASSEKIVLSDKPYVHHAEVPIVIVNPYIINDEFDDLEKFLKDKILWRTFVFVFQAMKFSAFYEHMKLLSDEQLQKFVLRTRAEFHDADNRRFLSKHYFPKEQWRALRMILDLPENVFITTLKLRRPKTSKQKTEKPSQSGSSS